MSRQRLLSWLRAAGEPSRLRLLSLCSQRDLSVSDLAQALHQSEPRVSRHLRILCEAGLLDRLRHGQWVQYRLAAQAPAAAFVQGLLGHLDPNDGELRRDLERTREAAGEAARAAGATGSRLGRALSGFMQAHAPAGPVNSVLVVGVEHPQLLEVAASMAAECTAIAHSRRAAQRARACAARGGFRCRV
ncbi:MAG TPA: metalloregulator ArsR/SmtB family transcription factor, partial [Steroidobacteraceae bacterium]